MWKFLKIKLYKHESVSAWWFRAIRETGENNLPKLENPTGDPLIQPVPNSYNLIRRDEQGVSRRGHEDNLPDTNRGEQPNKKPSTWEFRTTTHLSCKSTV